MVERNEFGGKAGTSVFTFLLPLFTYFIVACAFSGRLLVPESATVSSLYEDVVNPFLSFVSNECQFDWTSFGLYSGWFFIQLLFDQFLSGKQVSASSYYKDNENANINYQINGWKAWMFTQILALTITFQLGLQSMIISRLYSLMTIALIYSVVIATISYYIGYSQAKNEKKEEKMFCARIFDFIYDFWMGNTKYPSVNINPFSNHRLHLKLFCEARPGLQLWILIDYLLFYDYYVKFNHFNIQMFCVLLMQHVYISDYFWFEDAILTTMDLIHEKFGFMLSFGDLVWVPWTYTLQMQTLYFYYINHPSKVENLTKLSNFEMKKFIEFDHSMKLYYWCLILLIIFVFGYKIFRQSNLQKHLFRKLCVSKNKNNKVFIDKLSQLLFNNKPIEYIKTENGSKLLVSGWWAVGRHMNYTGDWLMTLSQAMICDNWSFMKQPSNIICYFNTIYFAILLIHRAQRDDKRCKNKYDKKWVEYCQKVPYVMIPFVY